MKKTVQIQDEGGETVAAPVESTDLPDREGSKDCECGEGCENCNDCEDCKECQDCEGCKDCHDCRQGQDQKAYKELYQRALADLENTRKRFETEKTQIARFAQFAAALDLLPVIDNFYRATEHVPAEQQQEAWVVGVMHIQKQLLEVLSDWGVSEIPAQVGDQFDPNLHEALGTTLNDQVPEDQIITIQSKGYRLQDRVLRPTKVIVSKSN